MRPRLRHGWSLSPGEATKLQQELALQVDRNDVFDDVKRVAGIDVGFEKSSGRMVAVVVVLDANTLEPLQITRAAVKPQFPALPGLVAFRELPAIVAALAETEYEPDLLVCSAGGLAHPRRFGLASHLGVLFNAPTIGCTKMRFLGEPVGELAPGRGAMVPLKDGQEVVGSVLRTQDDMKPVYVSVGHRVSLVAAADWILRLTPEYRLPETFRLADHELKRAMRDSRRTSV